MKHKKYRLVYLSIFVLLLAIEVLIALYVRDSFIRPYFGDVLVTVLLCCLVRIFLPMGVKLLPLYVFAFAVGVEVLQYLNIVSLLGLDEYSFFRIVIGTTFSFSDIVCYLIGCTVFWGVETMSRARAEKG